MRLRSIKVSHHRNLVSQTLEPSGQFNVFSGDNGQGKTNLLEAIYTVCTLRSFRTSRLRDLIAIGEERACIRACVTRDELQRLYEIDIGQRGRRVTLDGKTPRPLARYFGQFNVVLFAPEDLFVPRDSPSARRRFLDRAVFTQNTTYLAVAQDYEKVLRNRNALLRDDRPNNHDKHQYLDVFDEQLAGLARQVWDARVRYLDAISPLYHSAFEAISQAGLPARLRYRPGGHDSEPADTHQFLEQLRAQRHRDLARGTTSLGPHRDELQFILAEQEAPVFASQGQLRALVLAWKTAELELLTSSHGDAPILLLDDVSSELDTQRNQYLFDFLSHRRGQCFITTTHPRHVLVSGSCRRDWRVENGRLSET